MISFQEHRLGRYDLTDQVFSNKPVYAKSILQERSLVGSWANDRTTTSSEVQYIYFMPVYNIWLVGSEIGSKNGGFFGLSISEESERCPNDIAENTG